MALQAALALPNDRAYLFSPNGSYDVYDSVTGQFEATRDVVTQWKGLPATPNAAVYWGYGKAFFFAGGDYYRYDLHDDRVDDAEPSSIASGWTGLWTDGVDAAV